MLLLIGFGNGWGSFMFLTLYRVLQSYLTQYLAALVMMFIIAFSPAYATEVISVKSLNKFAKKSKNYIKITAQYRIGSQQGEKLFLITTTFRDFRGIEVCCVFQDVSFGAFCGLHGFFATKIGINKMNSKCLLFRMSKYSQ